MGSAAECDFLVMGAGVAGLRAALELAAHGNVLVVTKESVKESNTHYAQGGIAVAEPEAGEISLHLEDTVLAGDGLVYRPAAEALVNEGPQRVAELIEWGTRFDQENGHLLRTREAAHSLPRILHANGDATGAEISRSLAEMARAHRNIRFAEWTAVSRLVVSGGRVAGADLLNAQNESTTVCARSVLIAAGGAGQVYSDTTNPAVATGDGIALAAEAGAELADMEFYQFHPTAFALEGAPRFLLSEALRGEGAFLRNHRGERFMARYDERLELAPRDVVARAVAREGMGEGPEELRPVYLDMRHTQGTDLHKRFPGISAFLAKYGLDLQNDLIPVRPAAHYLMGGVKTDLEGRTTVKGLYAAGEVACTGVHGANRLASNSLLEGLVFGARAAKAMIGDGLELADASGAPSGRTPMSESDEELLEISISKLRRSMWAYAGLLRASSSLSDGLAAASECAQAVARFEQQGKQSRRLFEARAMSKVAEAIVRCAQARTESRGAHFRTDHPQHDDTNFRRHSIFGRGPEVVFETW